MNTCNFKLVRFAKLASENKFPGVTFKVSERSVNMERLVILGKEKRRSMLGQIFSTVIDLILSHQLNSPLLLD